ncbi:MAG: hypothetical protein V2J07_05765, partial [Anaerolineae bacterium]|nr:hypothetical protein [Anaerolineae bacterium]
MIEVEGPVDALHAVIFGPLLAELEDLLRQTILVNALKKADHCFLRVHIGVGSMVDRHHEPSHRFAA